VFSVVRLQPRFPLAGGNRKADQTTLSHIATMLAQEMKWPNSFYAFVHHLDAQIVG
jgi:hypothetical protein